MQPPIETLTALLERAAFLMERVSTGDHRALENLPDCAAQIQRVLKQFKTS